MSEDDKLRYFLKQVTANLHETRRRLQDLEAAAEEPLAIVGLGCRFPGGVRSPEDLWELAVAGREAAGELPRDRGWDGASPVRGGGFVYDATEFDPGFFGISPREAAAMDPQQRLLLETAWEALERAGIDPLALKGTKTGVFAGASFAGYGWFSAERGGLDGHLMTGNATSILSGRVSYTLGLEGPAVTVDTACSSALVALHLACRALRTEECSLALVGGAFVAATPVLFTDFSQHLGLSTDGKCKAFADTADGMGVAEGAGVLVVERLSDARRNGHTVLAVVRGSAVNQDGASNGLTAPNGPSQQRVIRAALASAHLSTADVDLVEAHGTGTPLGDPIEAQALLATYGQDRPEDRPLWLGSIKSNIGHAQQAAGIAGMMKMVMALHHRTLPRTLHADNPSHEIDWTAGQVRLIGESQEWPDHGRPRRGGVSGFGMSGTNVHVIVEEAPDFAETESEGAPDTGSDATDSGSERIASAEQPNDAEPAGEQVGPAVLAGSEATAWLVSGRTGEALAAQAGRLRELVLANPELKPQDVAWSLATTRATFENRAVVIGDFTEGLAAVATGQGAITGSASSPGRTVFVFPGQGSQWVGMGRDLLATSPVFAARLAECAEALAPHVGWSLLDIIENSEPLDTADIAQPVMWAVMVSLAAVWQASGIAPEAVIGHSQGEIAAATVAGILSLQDGAHVVVARSKALAELNASGGLLSVVMPESAVLTVLEETGFADRITVAAVNSPAATVVSGAPEDLDAFEAALSKRRILRWRVPATADFVAHSPRVEPIEQALTQQLASIAPQTGDVAFYSTARGQWLHGGDLGAGYWYANVREQVRFADAVVDLAQNGYRTFVEISAQPTLTGAITECVEEAGAGAPVVTGTVTREDPGPSGLLTSLARLHVAGVAVDWRAVLGGGERVDLPTYAFQNRRYWLQALEPAAKTDSGHNTEAEADFWAAVEGGDAELLANTLAVDDERLAEILPALASWRRRERADSVVADWRYKVTWAPVSDPGATVLSGTWLVVHPAQQDEITDQCVSALTERGAEVVKLQLGAADLDREAIAARLSHITAGDNELTGVVSLLALDEAPNPRYPGTATGLAGSLLLTQALGDAGIGARLWIVTRDAVAATAGDGLGHPTQGQAWGFGRVVGLEHPERWGGLLDLPPEWDDRIAARFAAVLAGVGDEDQVAVRAAGILGRRLVRPPKHRELRTWRPRGTVLITGGTGALGNHLGPWLTGRGAERIVLTSRSGPAAAGVAELSARLAGAGTRVDIVACDTSRRDEVAGLLGWITTDGPHLSSVMHAALVFDDKPVAKLELERLDRALAAKVAGARWLDELTAGLNLDAFVMYSSIAATWGAGHEPGYAAGNAYLDALAENRLARGLTATSIAYGPWASGGPTEGDAKIQLARRGLRLLEPPLAIEALARTLDAGESLVTIADATWEILGPTFSLRRRSPLMEGLPEVRAALAAAAEAEAAVDRAEPVGGELAGRLVGLTPVEQDRLLTEVIRTEAASVLGHDSADAVEAGRAFSDLGFDSLTSVELRNRLNAATGLRLPATLLFDYPTPAVLAEYLRTRALGIQAGPAGPVGGAVLEEPVAIVAMGCRYPGGVAGPDDLWDLVAAGGDAIAGFPTDRGWSQNLYNPDPDHVGTSYVREGGFINAASEFDAPFFGISPREALAMDPQQRMLLEVSWEALERAGINPQTLKGSRTGVFVGGAESGYQALGMQLALTGTEGIEGHLATGTAGSVLSGRLSYVLGLEGPAVTLDTACSSSLVALHMAAQAVQSGECDLALAGGVTMLATPVVFVGFSRQRGLAFDGRCKAFSDAADGMGMGEGAGMVVLERLSDARRNGHTVLAVIRGSAVNQDGASNGLTAPNGPSQQRVIRAALANGRLTTDDVDVVEAHGTGTPLGDPIEAQALMATYGQDRPADRPLWLGSVKSNIGHSQSAAGVAGVIKTVMALRNGLIPRTLHAEEPSHEIDWTAGNVKLLQEPVPWPAGERVRRAGVSAFGMSGTNVHVILEEAPAFAADETDETGAPAGSGAASGSASGSAASSGDEADGPVVLAVGSAVTAWPISGRSADALAGQAGRLREFVLARPELDPADVGWSLAATRATFAQRAVVIGSDRGDLAARLASVATAQETLGAISGAVPAGGVGRSVFVFPGQGSQWPGMGRDLLADSPVFAARFAECADALEPYIDWSPLAVLQQSEGAPTLESADIAQPVMWAVMVSLAAVWRASGVTPDAVIGHSQGEIAAATVAGILSLDDAARVVVLRSKALAGLGVSGGLLSAVMPESAANVMLRDHPALSVAAVNSPAATVISGPPEDLDRFEAALSKRRILRWRVPATSDFVAHSSRVRPIEDQLLDGLAGIRPTAGRTAFYSTAYNRWLPGHELTAAYWYANVREQVRFSDAVTQLAANGYRTFIEVSAQPVLTGAIAECVEEAGGQTPIVTGTVTREEPGATGLLTSLARVHVSGTDVDWTAVLTGNRVELPTYAFQRRRYWLDTPESEVLEEGTASAAEARFWAAVEGGDLTGIEDTLAIDPQRPLTELLPALASWRRREREDSAVADWRYRVTWTPLGEPGAAVLGGTWLTVTSTKFRDSDTVVGTIRALQERGAEVVTLEVDVADLDRAALAGALAEAGDSFAGVVSLLGVDERPAAEGIPFGVAGTLLLTQALGDSGINAPLWAVTQGAVSTASGDPLTNPAQAQIWGLGRVVALEHPERWGGLIDLPSAWDERIAARFSALISGGAEDQVAIRATGAFGRRLEHAFPTSAATTWQPRGTVLITGGTGALGGHVGRWLTGRGAERIVLTSRSGPGTRDIAGLAADLATAGTAVEVAACDTSQRSDVSALLDRIAATGPALSSVVHTAGIGQATMLAETSLAEQASVTAAKTGGAAVLDELTADLDLDAFVMFSSIAATWGGGMQPSYAAGNAYLDALAENRRSRGLAATSVAWGPWGGGGMTDADGAEQMARRGLRLMEPRLAVQALAGALDSGEDLLTVADMDWKRFAPVFVLRRPSPLIEALPEVGRALAETEAAAPASDGAQPALAEQLTGRPAAEQLRILTDLVRSEAASVLGYPSVDDVEPERAFSELGFDSLTSVDLRNRLSAATGLRLSATLLFDYPNPSVLADHLRAKWFPADADGLPLLAELDKLDALLSGATPDGELHEQVTARLQRFLATWSGIGPAGGDGAEVAKRIESASDDEIFDFIHRELGRS